MPEPDLLTERLALFRPEPEDADGMFEIFSDPAVWRHYPSLRHERPEQSRAVIDGWRESWTVAGLGSWVVRLPDDDRIIGCGGCTLLRGQVWNLGYRFAFDQQGRGYATEVAAAATERARIVDPARPVIAYLVAHNRASARVAEKVGLTLVHTVPDPGNPDPSVQRLIYADRPLSAAELGAASR